MNTIETLTEVFALASGAVDLADKLIEVTKGKGRKVDGDYAQIGSSGDYAQIDSTGEKAVVSAIGFRAVAKAKVGSWITLAEYKIDENKRWVVDFVKTEYVDGEKIKKGAEYGFIMFDDSGNRSSYKHCRPVSRDEVTFYEDKK